jgi:uncharacterized damage-inducible protein DinB
MPDHADLLREQLARALTWEEAHATFDKAVTGVPSECRGALADGFDHSAWQLVEHMRLAQRDLLDFCRDPRYSHTLTWPDDYWPRDAAPPSDAAWAAAIAAFQHDREQLQQMVRDAQTDLFALVPTGTGKQTFLRAVMLVIDHNAYHIGQLVALRYALGIWAR